MLNLRLRGMRAIRLAQRSDSHRGLLIGLAVVVFVVIGSLFGTVASAAGLIVTGVLTCGALFAVDKLIPWVRVPAQALLLFPGTWLLGLLVISLQVGPFASNFAGLTVLAFLYGGLTQTRWHTLWLLVPALPTWLVMVSGAGGATSLGLRLPIAVALWISASELVARHTHTMHFEVSRLNRQVDVDELTGLANRRALPPTLSGAQAGDALILIDIDHFKRINDEHGHTTGDHVLTQFGRTIRRCIRLQDEAIRYGGEELLVMMRQPGRAGIRRFDRQLRAEIQSIEPVITYSAGAAIIGISEAPGLALERADALLYDVKRSGRNRTVGDHNPS